MRAETHSHAERELRDIMAEQNCGPNAALRVVRFRQLMDCRECGEPLTEYGPDWCQSHLDPPPVSVTTECGCAEACGTGNDCQECPCD